MKILMTLLTLILCINIHAQSSNIQYTVLSKSYGDSIVLRWAPNDYGTWKKHVSGYIVKRTTIGHPDQVQQETIYPIQQEEWEKLLTQKQNNDISTKYVAIAAQMIYGQEMNISFKNDMSADAINLANEQQLRHSYAMLCADISVVAANAMGLRYRDQKVKLGESYLYQITPILSSNETGDKEQSFQVAAHCLAYKTPVILPKLVIEEFDHVLSLKCYLKLFKDEFTAYIIERSTQEDRGFEVLTKAPIVILNKAGEINDEISHFDMLKENGRTYYYRLKGITPFGDLSPPSKISSGMGIDRTLEESPTITEVGGEKNKTIEIKWEMEEIDDLAGFWVGKSDQSTGPFQLCHREILPRNSRQFIDEFSSDFQKIFYHVLAVDRTGNMSVSQVRYATITDNEPPAIPYNLKAKADSTGFVLLRWDAVTDDDILGYHVQYANDTTHAFSNLTGQLAEQNLYIDSISTQAMNKYIYYKVSAVDKNYNRSSYSKILRVQRYHDFKLQAPIISNLDINGEKIVLSWKKSSHPLANGYKVFVQSKKTNEWKLYKTIRDTKITNCVFELEEGNYRFAIKSFSEFAQESPFSLAINGRVQSANISNIDKLSGKLKADNIELKWTTGEASNHSIVIYKSIDDKPLQSIAKVDGNSYGYTDSEIQKPGTYKYLIRAVNQAGQKSDFSESVVVEVY